MQPGQFRQGPGRRRKLPSAPPPLDYVPTNIDMPELREGPRQDPFGRFGEVEDDDAVQGRNVTEDRLQRQLAVRNHPLYLFMMEIATNAGLREDDAIAKTAEPETALLVQTQNGPVIERAPYELRPYDENSEANGLLKSLIYAPPQPLSSTVLEAFRLLFSKNQQYDAQFMERVEECGRALFNASFVGWIKDAMFQLHTELQDHIEFTPGRLIFSKDPTVVTGFARLCAAQNSDIRNTAGGRDNSLHTTGNIVQKNKRSLNFFKDVRWLGSDYYVVPLGAESKRNKPNEYVFAPLEY